MLITLHIGDSDADDDDDDHEYQDVDGEERETWINKQAIVDIVMATMMTLVVLSGVFILGAVPFLRTLERPDPGVVSRWSSSSSCYLPASVWEFWKLVDTNREAEI